MSENSQDRDTRKVKSYETDGEKITYEDSTQAIEAEKWERKKKAARNPWKRLGIFKISTQGPER